MKTIFNKKMLSLCLAPLAFITVATPILLTSCDKKEETRFTFDNLKNFVTSAQNVISKINDLEEHREGSESSHDFGCSYTEVTTAKTDILNILNSILDIGNLETNDEETFDGVTELKEIISNIPDVKPVDDDDFYDNVDVEANKINNAIDLINGENGFLPKASIDENTFVENFISSVDAKLNKFSSWAENVTAAITAAVGGETDNVFTYKSIKTTGHSVQHIIGNLDAFIADVDYFIALEAAIFADIDGMKTLYDTLNGKALSTINNDGPVGLLTDTNGEKANSFVSAINGEVLDSTHGTHGTTNGAIVHQMISRYVEQNTVGINSSNYISEVDRSISILQIADSITDSKLGLFNYVRAVSPAIGSNSIKVEEVFDLIAELYDDETEWNTFVASKATVLANVLLGSDELKEGGKAILTALLVNPIFIAIASDLSIKLNIANKADLLSAIHTIKVALTNAKSDTDTTDIKNELDLAIAATDTFNNEVNSATSIEDATLISKRNIFVANSFLTLSKVYAPSITSIISSVIPASN